VPYRFGPLWRPGAVVFRAVTAVPFLYDSSRSGYFSKVCYDRMCDIAFSCLYANVLIVNGQSFQVHNSLTSLPIIVTNSKIENAQVHCSVYV
jgi:hypothetical protein